MYGVVLNTCISHSEWGMFALKRCIVWQEKGTIVLGGIPHQNGNGGNLCGRNSSDEAE